MKYETYYGATTATGASQYLYPASNSQSNSSGGNSNSGSGNNGTGATSPPTGPPQPLQSLPPPPPPPPTHFYATAAPPPHHHPPVPAGPPPQVDHIYYSFPAGPHPPPPPHAPMGLTDQQLLLYPTDTHCQQTSSSDGQTAPQEDSRPTSRHSEQAHGETQAASGSATPLVSLMPVKFPMSGRYTNYHPITIHTANLYSSQTCLNETDDCTGGNQMHCRAIVYHPTTVYIPHAHTPSFHNVSSGGSSLLPTPASVSQQIFDSANKNQCFVSREYSKSGSVNGQNSYSKSQNQGIALSAHQGPFVRGQTVGNAQSYKHSNVEGNYKYSPAIASRYFTQYNKKTAVGSTVGSPACFLTYKPENYGGAQACPQKSAGFASNATGQPYFDYATGTARRNNFRNHCNADGYYDGSNRPGNYATRKHATNSYRNNGSVVVHSEGNGSGDQSSNDSYSSNVVANESNGGTQSNAVTPTAAECGNSEKPVSPPPAPYSPMTRPLPILSPPASQVQFYGSAQTRYQTSLAPSQYQQQSSNSQRRYTIAPALSASRKSSTEKYTNTGSGQTTMLRQSKYKVNGIMQTGNKVSEDSLGGAGDAPPGVGRMPITPPGTPQTHPAHPVGDQSQLTDTCHQMQALNL